MSGGPCQNTDRELWRERPGDYYSDCIFVTENGAIGIDCGGFVIVKPVREWHALAAPPARIEEPAKAYAPWSCVRCGCVNEVRPVAWETFVRCVNCDEHRDAKAPWARIEEERDTALRMADTWPNVDAHCSRCGEPSDIPKVWDGLTLAFPAQCPACKQRTTWIVSPRSGPGLDVGEKLPSERGWYNSPLEAALGELIVQWERQRVDDRTMARNTPGGGPHNDWLTGHSAGMWQAASELRAALGRASSPEKP